MTDETTAPTSDEVVYGPWSLDGSTYDRDHLAAAGSTVGELIRWSNHATLNAPTTTLTYAGDAGRLAGAYSGASKGMEQLLQQTANRVRRIAEDPALYDYEGDDPTVTAAEAETGLREAAQLAAQLSEVLSTVHSKLSQLGHRD